MHTSDWHLGKILHAQSLLEDQVHMLEQIKSVLADKRCDALVIAGDIYDRAVPPKDAIECLNHNLSDIVINMGIPVVMISGNHDAAERLGFGAQFMKHAGLHIMSNLQQITTPVVLSKQGVEVAFYGIPYCDPHTVRSTFIEEERAQAIKTFDDAHTFLVEKIKAVMSPQQHNVLLSHCFVQGGHTSDSERTLQVGGADQVSPVPCEAFDYVALGHLHKPQYKGAPHVRYSGSPLKYSFSEVEQPKGVTMVTCRDDMNVPHSRCDFAHLDLPPRRDLRVVEGTLAQIMAQASTDLHTQDYLLARLTDTEALIDPMQKLRQVYPNILHIERPQLSRTIENTADRQAIKNEPEKLVGDFYAQITDAPLSKAQAEIVKTTLNTLTSHTQGA
jgi:exonuclease SbcD